MRFLKGVNFCYLILSHLYKSTLHVWGLSGNPIPGTSRAPQHGMHQEMNQMHKSRHLFSGAGWAPQQNTSFLMLHSGNQLQSDCSFSLLGHQKQRLEIKSFCSLSRKSIKYVGKSKYFQSLLANDKCWKQYFQRMGKLELKWKKVLLFSFQAQYSFICQTPHLCNTSSEFYIQRSMSC